MRRGVEVEDNSGGSEEGRKRWMWGEEERRGGRMGRRGNVAVAGSLPERAGG